MPQNDHYVIIGNGPAGNKAADVLRENDGEARITIISDEAFSFYYRHKLPQFTAGTINEADLRIRPYNEYKDKNIRMRLGQRVERIDPNEKTLFLEHMEKVQYSKLILAVGGRSRIPTPLAPYQDDLVTMSRYSDAVKIKPRLEKVENIVMLGGDLTSLGFIKQLINLNKHITFFLYHETFWPLELTREISEEIRDSLKQKGVDVYIDDRIESIAKHGEDYQLTTEKGAALKAEMICCFMGLTPNIRFLLGSGIDTERGVLVDQYLRSNYPDVYACGDCAQIYNPEIKSYWVSIGWLNAETQGEIAARNLLGDYQVIRPAPRNVLEVEGVRLNTSWWKGF